MSAVDAIGILFSTLDAVHKTYNFIKSYKNASREMQELEAEVKGVQSVLRRIVADDDRKEEDAYPDAQRFPPELIEQAEQLMRAANAFIEKATIRRDASQNGGKSHWHSRVSRMKNAVTKVQWTLRDSETKNLALKFRTFYVKVSAVYSMKAWYVLRCPAAQSYLRIRIL